jgi:hypothetical protein
MVAITERGIARNSAVATAVVPKIPRRDAPVTCASCGREVRRRGRLQLYCSTRCRKRGHYARSVRRGVFLRPPVADTALGTTPLKEANKFKALRRAKLLSSHRILAPKRVLAIEVFGRVWQHATSSDDVVVEIGRIRMRALVAEVQR